MAPDLNILPNLAGAGQSINWPFLINIILMLVVVGSFLGILIRFLQHRNQVKIYEKVKDGYVITYGRYAVAYDKETKLEYLRPMFGSKRLPNFQLKYWQKAEGVPLIGVKRILSMVKQNEDSFKAILPPDKTEDHMLASIHYENTLNWVFYEQLRIFTKELQKKKLLDILALIAPLVVISASLIFLIVAIFTQSNLTMEAAKSIEKSTEILAAAVGK